MIICKNDDERKLRKAIYIGDGGQVTTPSGRSLSGGPDRSQGVPRPAILVQSSCRRLIPSVIAGEL